MRQWLLSPSRHILISGTFGRYSFFLEVFLNVGIITMYKTIFSMSNPSGSPISWQNLDARKLKKVLLVFTQYGKNNDRWTLEMNAVGVSLEYVRNQVALALFELRTQRQEDVSVSPKAIALDKLELVVESNMKSLLWDGSEGSSRDFHAVEMDLEPCANLGHPHLLVLIEKIREQIFLHILMTDWPLDDGLLQDFVPPEQAPAPLFVVTKRCDDGSHEILFPKGGTGITFEECAAKIKEYHAQGIEVAYTTLPCSGDLESSRPIFRGRSGPAA